jgi:ascorbate-specific PTS system EIIC-type component UlaA
LFFTFFFKACFVPEFFGGGGVLGVSGNCWGGWREAGLTRLVPSSVVASVSGFSVYNGIVSRLLDFVVQMLFQVWSNLILLNLLIFDSFQLPILKQF